MFLSRLYSNSDTQRTTEDVAIPYQSTIQDEEDDSEGGEEKMTSHVKKIGLERTKKNIKIPQL